MLISRFRCESRKIRYTFFGEVAREKSYVTKLLVVFSLLFNVRDNINSSRWSEYFNIRKVFNVARNSSPNSSTCPAEKKKTGGEI